jgi:tight adherence protein C
MPFAMPWLAPALAACLALLPGVALLLWRDIRRAERLSIRLRMVRQAAGPPEPEPDVALPTSLRIVIAIGEAIARSGLLSTRTLEELRLTLRTAGFGGGHGLGLFVGTKLLLVAGLPLATLVVPWLSHLEMPHQTAFLAIAAGIGLLAPDKVVQHLRKRYLRALEAGMPDALDMMVICAQAGLGLGPAIIRVADEMKLSYRELAIEFSLTANELQILSDTRIALHNLGHRTGLEAFRRLAMTLIQTIQYGTPLTDALRTLSAEMRQEALTAFEESAARLPTMLTLPMIIFILPCVFLIAGGPAIIQVMHSMSN